ncbi:MAG: hypothetical protein MZW92_79445 [Comamonadaceae bacterium]|nr:hypothetical protein [Comamonadaceae bacterium]
MCALNAAAQAAVLPGIRGCGDLGGAAHRQLAPDRGKHAADARGRTGQALRHHHRGRGRGVAQGQGASARWARARWWARWPISTYFDGRRTPPVVSATPRPILDISAQALALCLRGAAWSISISDLISRWP